MPTTSDAPADARALLLRHIRAQPGCHLRELERNLPLSLGALRHHLDRLHDEGLVRVEFDRRYKRYYPADMPVLSRRAHAALRQAKLRAVVLALAQRPGARHAELSRALGVPRSSLSAYLRRLQHLGLVRAVPGDGYALDPGVPVARVERLQATRLDRLADAALSVLEEVERAGSAARAAAPRAFEACIFDLDGVLADSMPQHWLGYAAALRGHGVEPRRDEVFRREGMNARHVARDILREHGVAVDEAEAARLGEAKQAAFRDLGRPALFPGAERAVDALRAAGLRVALVTGTSRENARFILGPLAERFDALLADGDYARSKPDPEPYALAARRLGVPPERCAVVENAPLGVRAAIAAGMACIALPTTVAPAELRAAGAHAVARDLEDAVARVLRGEGFKRG